MKVKIEWKTDQHRLGPNTYVASVGPYRVASVVEPLTRRHEARAYRVNFALPGMAIKASLNNFSNPDDAKKMAELGIIKWFENTAAAVAK